MKGFSKTQCNDCMKCKFSCGQIIVGISLSVYLVKRRETLTITISTSTVVLKDCAAELTSVLTQFWNIPISINFLLPFHVVFIVIPMTVPFTVVSGVKRFFFLQNIIPPQKVDFEHPFIQAWIQYCYTLCCHLTTSNETNLFLCNHTYWQADLSREWGYNWKFCYYDLIFILEIWILTVNSFHNKWYVSTHDMQNLGSYVDVGGLLFSQVRNHILQAVVLKIRK